MPIPELASNRKTIRRQEIKKKSSKQKGAGIAAGSNK